MRKIIQTAFLLTLAAPITAQSLRDSLTVTGAMITVTQERMNKGMITNSLDALSGQAAGVQVQSYECVVPHRSRVATTLWW